MDYLNYGKEKPSALSTIGVRSYKKPFPHLILENFYDENELELIWEELKFYTKPNKLFGVKDYDGAVGYTNAQAIPLDSVYLNYEEEKINFRSLSNILTVSRKIFTNEILKIYTEIDHCCNVAMRTNRDVTKVRYYHDGEYYKPHVDAMFHTLAFSYFHKEPKSFSGGELYFPYYNYEFPCHNNTIIIFPAWVEHGVREVEIKNSDYYDGLGRYAITSFLKTEV
tara:strand:- start:44 stop:715 length:672 start_codon:yes stop_codon:yes gene_type:complete